MAGNPLTDPNWAPDLADTVQRLVGNVRDKVTDKAVVAVRAAVFGVIIGLAALAAFTLTIIVGTRLVQVVTSRIFRTDHNSTIWVSYMVMGGLLMLLGIVCMKLRHSKAAAA
jgi:hypothetical protein